MYKAVSTGDIGHGGKNFKESAELCKKFGYGGYWFNIIADSQIPVSETKEILNNTGLKAAGFGLPVEFRSDKAEFEADFAKLEGYAKYAAEIGATRSATYILPFSNTYTYDDNYELHVSRLKKCSELLNEYGILLGLEFVGPPKLRKGAKYEFIYNLDGILDLCNAIGTKNCGLLLDVFHWDMAGQTRDDFCKITNEQIALVHIMDAPAGIAIEEQEDLIRRLPGETGVLKIAEFFDGLKSIGYDGPVAVEPFEKKLSTMPFEQALKTVMTAINKVWSA